MLPTIHNPDSPIDVPPHTTSVRASPDPAAVGPLPNPSDREGSTGTQVWTWSWTVVLSGYGPVAPRFI
ncbi:hypothetical protein ACIRP2_21600 [Streptomyces sp. NPDC101194]|uniref:hypothetical protein n=1 Tax=Streptomyces sp. NPDC101194 TaxID=3366127 RepID=UPI0037F4D74E